VSLTVGSRLGSHEILGLLGAGGMGEVFPAEDTKLKRRVAIKVLPAAAASDPDRVARFHREAQAVAALNHPGIAAIYDLAESGGTTYLVLELIDGETLAQRLKRGPLAVDEAVAVARQILDALEAAHDLHTAQLGSDARWPDPRRHVGGFDAVRGAGRAADRCCPELVRRAPPARALTRLEIRQAEDHFRHS
jgi:serine/threonine protein kinase